MSTSYIDEFEQYEDQFDPLRTDRRARRSRKPKIKHTPKKSTVQVVEEIAGSAEGLEAGFVTTYQPSRYEQEWLLSSLETFYDQMVITDVLFQVRGGKEASVYCCAAHPSTGQELLAVKVYRPRKFRQLRNDKTYREGRSILTAEGRAVKKNDHRIMRAVGKKTAFGEEVAHTSWLMHEYTTLGHLYHDGAAVPQPFAATENAIVMAYIGDEQMAAPILSEVRLETDEAPLLFDEAKRNVELMLKRGLIHGDLSAYNILYWQGEITLIDFPQVINSQTNGSAYTILLRDITRLCEYFAKYGLKHDAEEITADLWTRYVRIRPEDRILDDVEP